MYLGVLKPVNANVKKNTFLMATFVQNQNYKIGIIKHAVVTVFMPVQLTVEMLPSMNSNVSALILILK